MATTILERGSVEVTAQAGGPVVVLLRGRRRQWQQALSIDEARRLARSLEAAATAAEGKGAQA